MAKGNQMNVPNHIAFVLDGNRRWAKGKKMNPWEGHWEGSLVADKVLDWCLELNVPQVSMYVLSSENFDKRSKKELEELFNVYYDSLKRWEEKMDVLDKYEVKVRFVGDIDKLPPKLKKLMGKFMQRTAKYQKRVINLLINYGGHFEIAEMVKKMAKSMIKAGKITVTNKDIQANLLVPVPVDLVVRTGGKARLSNMLLWQTAYAEIYVTKTLWPDFNKKELIKAIKWFNNTKKNYGR